MFAAVTLLPLAIFVLVALRRGVERAFVWVGLPALLLLPNYYTYKLPGIPRFDFTCYVLLASAAGMAWRTFRPSLFDLGVLFYVVLITAAEWSAKSAHEARNLFALSTMGILAPYVIGKCLARRREALLAVVAMIVALGALIGWLSPYEARMGANPFDWLRGLWPHHVPWDGALYRGGFRRVAGPFAHPICHGFFFSFSIPLFLWLRRENPRLRGTTGKLLLAGNLLGLAFALSRGPILGLLITLWGITFGWTRRRALLVVLTGLVALVGVTVSFDAVTSYFEVTRGEATTESQETAAYRKEMLEAYWECVLEHPWLGFGKDQIPVLKGMKSIDNQYLFLSLTYGLPAAFVFLGLLLVPAGLASLQLLLRGRRQNADHDLQWVLAASLFGAILTQLTVFSGTQTTQVLFLVIGLLVGSRLETRGSRASSPETRPASRGSLAPLPGHS